MENFSIDVFLQYGVLGIIAWVFLQMVSKLFNSQLEQFKMLLDTIIEKNDKPVKDIEDSISLIQQMMNNHQKYLMENIHNLTDKINSSINEKDDIWKLFMNHEQQTIQHTQDINERLNEFRILLSNIEKRYNNKISCEKLEFLLTEKTSLTQSNIRDIIDNVKNNE